MSALLTAYDLAERTERNEPEHHGAEKFSKNTRVPREVKTLDSLSDKAAAEQAHPINEVPAWGKQYPYM